MSKAFTRESDLPDLPLRPRPARVLPPGAKNYLTAAGAEQARRELDRLLNIERPRLTAAGTVAEAELQSLQQRIAQLQEILQTAVVVPPPAAPDDVVRFGAIVSVRERSGEQSTYRIVGVDETDLDRNWVSWISPIARALLNARVGQRVRFRFPTGEEELEILAITYE